MTDHEQIRNDVREAVQGVTAVVSRREFVRRSSTGEGLDDLWQAMADQGILGLGVPEELGGSGAGITAPVAAMEALSESGIPPVLFLLTAFAREAIIRHGSDQQKERYVAPTTTGKVRLCFAITEADAGTNSFAMKTFARQDGEQYILRGEKVFISGANEATHAMIVARTTRLADAPDKRFGLSLFVVPIGTPGLTMTKMRIDLHSPEHQYVLHLDDVAVPAADLIGVRDEGLRALFDALNPERLLVSAWAIGLGAHVLQRGVDYARDRSPFGTSIGAYQAVQHPLARAHAHLDAARLVAYTACQQFDAGRDASAYANMAKLLASESADAAADAVMQTFGGSAFDQESDIVTLWPMIRLLRIAPVNNEMVLNYIAERLLRLPKSY